MTKLVFYDVENLPQVAWVRLKHFPSFDMKISPTKPEVLNY